MHFECMKKLDIRPRKRNFFCPVCVSLKAAQRAAKAEKAAVAAEEAAAAAKEKLKAFKRESRLNRRSCGVSATSLEKADKLSRRRSSLQSGENDRSLKPKQPSDDNPTLSEKEEQPTMLRIEYHEPERRDSEHLLPEDMPQSHGVPSVEQGKDVTLRVSASLSRVSVNVPASPKVDVITLPHVPQPSEKGSRGMGEQTAPTSEMRIPDEENAEQVRAGVADPGNRAGCRGEVEDDEEGDNDGAAEDRSEDRNRAGAALFSGRHKLPGVRRIRVPWTRQEEHVLEVGVKRYSNNGAWGFQWKRIREFSQGTFDPSRTEVDLKVKWRNLVRAAVS